MIDLLRKDWQNDRFFTWNTSNLNHFDRHHDTFSTNWEHVSYFFLVQ